MSYSNMRLSATVLVALLTLTSACEEQKGGADESSEEDDDGSAKRKKRKRRKSAASSAGAPSGDGPQSNAKVATCTAFWRPWADRAPIQSTVKGARVPGGGVVRVKTSKIFSVDYFSQTYSKFEVACAIRKQLEDDKWTIESMTATSPVDMLARKGPVAIKVMVGPDPELKDEVIGSQFTKAILLLVPN